MAPPKPVFWGPYVNQAEARSCLGAFAARVIGPGAGVIYCDGVGATYLQKPFYDADGSGLVLVATCRAEAPPPAPPPAPSGLWQRIERVFEQSMATVGEAEIQNSQAQLAMGQQEAQWLKQGWTSLHDFVEGHKTTFDGVAVVGDIFGVLAGIAAVVVIGTTGVAVLPVLALVAGVASLALLAEDGTMLVADIRGDEVRKKELEESWHYKTIELIGPLLLLPDLLLSGPRAVTGVAKTAAELRETREAVGAGQEALDAQREANDAYKEAHAGKLKQNNIKTKMQAGRTKVNKLVRDLKNAQERLADAQREFKLLRAVELPAYAGSLYAQGLYAVEPPDYLKDLTNGSSHEPVSGQSREAPHPIGAHQSTGNPMELLIPQRSGHQPPSAQAHMNFQVAVSRNAAVKR
jgi:hypothetical protein